jgi:uncharacterized membrane protein
MYQRTLARHAKARESKDHTDASSQPADKNTNDLAPLGPEINQLIPKLSRRRLQHWKHGKVDVRLPVGFVQQLPRPQQAAIVLSLFVALALNTWFMYAGVGPVVATMFPGMYAFFCRWAGIALGLMFVVLGITHFTAHDGCCTMMPRWGTWGFWYLPGSASFHVNWTAIPEILGGVGMIMASFPVIAHLAPWLGPLSNYGQCLLTYAVSFAGAHMLSHNAPGPGPLCRVMPMWYYMAGFLFQSVLLSMLLSLARVQTPKSMTIK